MLSSQTKDAVTYAAMDRLIDSGLTVNKIITMSEASVGELIYPVSFWRVSEKNIEFQRICSKCCLCLCWL